MTKNRRLCCRRRPIFNAPSPTNQGQHPFRPWCGDFAPCLSSDASLHVSVSHRSILREAGWSTSHFLLRMHPPKLQTRRHSSPRSISIVSSRGDKGKVRNCLVGFVFQSKLTFLFVNFPASAEIYADLVSWRSNTPPPTPCPDRYRWYRSETKARRWVLCLFLLRTSPETHQFF
jgi:hypothetical protein